MLKNAKDTCASETLEIASYTALERFATSVGDEQTAKLAASVLADEERMLERIMREIPKLTEAVVGADVQGKPSDDITKTGAVDATRDAAHEVKQSARETQARAKRGARQARKVPGGAQVEGRINGAVASEQDRAIARYDSLTAEEILGKLPELSQVNLAKLDAYEHKNDNRTTVLSRISALRNRSRGPGMTSSRLPRSKRSSARATSSARTTSLRTSASARTAQACSAARSARPPGPKPEPPIGVDSTWWIQANHAVRARTEPNELRPRSPSRPCCRSSWAIAPPPHRPTAARRGGPT